MHISLTHRDFANLVRGYAVEHTYSAGERDFPLVIGLENIGHALMAYEIAAAARNRPSDGLPLSYSEGMRRTGACLIPVARSDPNQFLFCFNNRRQGWEFPGGKNERDESLATTALREFEEESGIAAGEPSFLFFDDQEPGWLVLFYWAFFTANPRVMEPEKVPLWQLATLDAPPQPLTGYGQRTVETLAKLRQRHDPPELFPRPLPPAEPVCPNCHGRQRWYSEDNGQIITCAVCCGSHGRPLPPEQWRTRA